MTGSSKRYVFCIITHPGRIGADLAKLGRHFEEFPKEELKKVYYKNAIRVIPGIDESLFPE